jgi:hypothetical protein
MDGWCRSTSSEINVGECEKNNFKKVHEEPIKDKRIINAFHKDYVSTYFSSFITKVKAEEQQKANGAKFGAKAREKEQEEVVKKKNAAKPITYFPLSMAVLK